MLLRPRQSEFVERSLKALREHGNTLGVAPTGAGKTVMMSGVITGINKPTLVLQHRDELVEQNRLTLHKFHKSAETGIVNASRKEFSRKVTYAMVQTLARNLDLMRPVDLVCVDEAHHIAAKSYEDIIGQAREMNPDVKLMGVSATPNRGDKKALRKHFSNVSDQITLGELISTGALVPPRTFVIDLGVQGDLNHVKRNVNDFDMNEVEKIMDKRPLNAKVVEAWKEKAGDRQTVVFCSTVEHARHVHEEFARAGVSCGIVSGDMPSGERRATLKAFDNREFQVLCNVMVLTEGWDCQPVSCVVLLRPSSFKSTMIQMIGRGLRRLDPERYPGQIKDNCIVLDFGTSILTHGSLEDEVDLDPVKGEGLKKECPECGAKVPIRTRECAVCGHEFDDVEDIDGLGGNGVRDPEGALESFVLTEIDLFNQSPYRWEDIWLDESVLVATAFEAWAMVIQYEGRSYALGGSSENGIRVLNVGDRILSLSTADDFLREHGDTKGAAKSKTWLHMPATEKQAKLLPYLDRKDVTRYQAACHMTWKFNAKTIKQRLMGVRHAA